MHDRVGVIGLGVMGSAMSANLVAAGFEVAGYDIDPDRVSAAARAGVSSRDSASAVADEADIVLLSLPSPGALAQVCSELASRPRQGLLVLETGTFPLADKSSARDSLDGAGIELMDVPLSGTGLQAVDATLVVLASGSRAGFERAVPVLEAIGRSIHYLGDFGNGSRMKYLANLLVAVHTLAAAEAHALGKAAGMTPSEVQEVMEDGVGSSKMLEIRGPMMVAGEYPAAARLDIILKDARLIKQFAEEAGAPTPLLDTAVEVYAAASQAGYGDLDAAALCAFLEERRGSRG